MTIQPDTYLLLSIGLGLFAFGFNLFRFGVKAVGFGLGFMFGYSLYDLILKWLPAIVPDAMKYLPQDKLAVILAGCIFGIIGVFLARKVFQATLFTALLGTVLYVLYGNEEYRGMIERLFELIGILDPINQTLGNAWPALLAIVVALLFIFLEKQALMVLTACVGSFLIAGTINVPITFLPLCFFGYLIQWYQGKKKKKDED
jgi:hypothetical protein